MSRSNPHKNKEEIIEFLLKGFRNINIGNNIFIDRLISEVGNENITIRSVTKFIGKGHYLTVSYWVNRGWLENEAKIFISEKQKVKASMSSNLEKIAEKRNISLDDAQVIRNKIKDKIRKSVKDNETEKIKRNPDYLKENSHHYKEFWVKKGMSEEDAIKESKKIGKKNREKFKVLLDDPDYEHISWTSYKYWMEKEVLSEDEAKSKVSKLQVTFSKETCIKKYGEDEGLKIWQKRQDKWKSKVFNNETHISRGTSEISEEFISLILVKINFQKDDLLFGKNEKFIRDNGEVFKFDLTVKSIKKIIEFNGDFWHCNPIKYKADYYHKIKKMTAQEMWDYDERKKNSAIKHGYTVFYVWESDYKSKPSEIINDCINFLQSNV